MTDDELEELYTALGIANDEANKMILARSLRLVAKGSLILDEEGLADIYSDLGITNDETKKLLVRLVLPLPTDGSMADEQLEALCAGLGITNDEAKKKVLARARRKAAKGILDEEELADIYGDLGIISDETKKLLLRLALKQEEQQASIHPPSKKRKMLIEQDELENRKKRREMLMKENEELKKRIQEKEEKIRKAQKFWDARSLRSLLNAPEGRFRLNSKRKVRHTADTTHGKAKLEPLEGFELSSPDNESLKSEHYDKCHSTLFLYYDRYMRKRRPLSFYEKSILVESAVSDAIDILDLEGYFEGLSLRRERGLFGCSYYDMLVVRDEENVGLIAIKTAGRTKNAPSVVNKAYDHAMAMKAFNCATNIVLVTAFDESFLGCLKAEDLLQGDKIETKPAVSHSTGPNRVGQSLSPARIDFKRIKDPKLYVPEKDFGAHELVKLIYTALKRSKKAYERFQKTPCKLEHGATYLFSRAMQVVHNTKEWHWGTLKAKIGNDAYQSDGGAIVDSSEGTYYLIGSLGEGSSSHVYQALDHSGELVTIKMFLEEIVGDEEEEEDDEEYDDEESTAPYNREKIELEACHSFLKGRVRVIKICGFYAVVMPIFEPVDDRADKLKEIRKILVKMKERGKKYAPYDVSFRHVGIFKDNDQEHVVLFDLADLVDTDDPDYIDSENKELDPVEEQMQIFTTLCSEDNSPGNFRKGLFGDAIKQS